MTIEELRQERNILEKDIVDKVAPILEDFINRTGINFSDIQVGVMEPHFCGSTAVEYKRHIFARVSLDLGL